MNFLSSGNGLKIAAFFVILFSNTGTANAQTVVFKQPPPANKLCMYDTQALEIKIAELKNVNAQLAERAKKLETQVMAMKVAKVAKHKKTQVCKRWKNRKCTWLVWK